MLVIFCRSILQRVAEVMIVFCFTHLCDAVAVSDSLTALFQTDICMWKMGFDQITVFSWKGVTGGVLRGAGKQLVGALCNLVGYYFIGFPIGVSLMFAANMGILGKNWSLCVVFKCTFLPSAQHKICCLPSFIGLWTGLTVCVLMQSTFFIIFLSKINWEKAAKEVRTRFT